MATPSVTPRPSARHASRVRQVGCVSFLNARPLIEGLDGADPRVRFDVPSRLLDDLERGEVDAALCPVIDYQRSRVPLVVLPVGGIGCRGTTLTVRLFSQTPLPRVCRVYADTDSHTSVALLRVLLAEQFGITPQIIDYHARERVAENRPIHWPQTMLLIGDKVVTDSPPAIRYPHQLDLGHAWFQATGLPFVFAIWMARAGEDLGDLPAKLEQTRRTNVGRIDEIVQRHAEPHGWPQDLARRYLGHWLHYEIEAEHLEAIRRFSELAHQHGLIDTVRAIEVL